MYSLTAEEQWKIIQEEERRKKKKTLTEQLVDMGGFGHDPDSEEEIRKDLECVDTRLPLQLSDVPIPDRGLSDEESIEESAFWGSRKRLFNSWIFQANRPSSWIEEKHLPLLFRFALGRPIMDELSFQVILQDLNVQLDVPMGDLRQPYTRPVGRSRRLMFGIDVDEERKFHPSSVYRNSLPKGATEDTDRVTEEAKRIVQQDDEDMQQLTRRQLWTVYEHVQNGSVPLETATWHYRDAFNSQDMSDETLFICLQQFDIPTDHIPTNKRDARRRSAHCPSPSGVESSRKEGMNTDIPDATAVANIDELTRYIRLYREGALHEREAIYMIQDCLKGLNTDVRDISDILTDFEKDEKTAAILMWDDACENDDTPMTLGPLIISSSSSSSLSSSEEEVEESDEEQAEPLPAVPDPLMSPIAVDPGKRPTYSPANEAESTVQPRDTPRPEPARLAAATEKSVRQADIESDREPPRDRENVGRRRLSSPDDGMTTGIWGLLMPTKEARRLAHEMKLPQDTINQQVRSMSPRRIKRRRASYAKTIVTFPKSKRKASITLHSDTPPKSPKHGDHSDIFAREGEDQATFVLSHFDRDAIGTEDTCIRCLRLPCECVYGSSPHSGSEPECPKCLQESCVCARLADLDEAIPSAPLDGRPSFDALRAKTVHRTQPEPPKQSGTLLAYLARVLDEVDVLASIRKLKRLSPTSTTVADAKAILNHIRTGTVAGEKLDATGNDDREAIRILDDLIESSQTLTDCLHELHCGVEEEKAFTTSDDHRLDGVSEVLDNDSSLLNSSFNHEHVPTPPPNSDASAAAFPETQSNFANVSAIQANNKPLARGISPYLPITAPDSNAPALESSSDIENAVQSSRLQASTFPDSSAAGDPSRAEPDSGSPARGELSTTGGRPSEAPVFPSSPARSPPSSTADLSKQVSEHPVDAERDTGRDTWGAPLTRQSYSTLRDAGDSEVEKRPPPSPRPGAKQLSTSIPPSSPRPSFKGLPKSTPPPAPRPRRKKLSRKMNATAQSCLKSRGSDSLPAWPSQSGLPENAGKEWMSLTPKKALEYAKKEAFRQRKSFAFYLEERRAVKTRIKKENDHANSTLSDHSFFQSSNGLSGSSGSSTTLALNKLFDKYRGTSDI